MNDKDLIGLPLNRVMQVDAAREKLDALYSTLPETVGCLNNIAKEGGCNSWCCRTQNPQVLYVEFMSVWQYVNHHWDGEAILQLIAAAIRNFLNNNVQKGCIYHDGESNLCTVHEHRPLACRTYGIMPDSDWKPRYEKLKIIYPNEPWRGQCDLVTTENGQEVTKKNTDDWWEELKRIELSIGVPKSQITDAPGGTYRTFHDHLMITLYGKDVLVELSKMRLNATQKAKEKLIDTVVSSLRKKRLADAASSATPPIPIQSAAVITPRSERSRARRPKIVVNTRVIDDPSPATADPKVSVPDRLIQSGGDGAGKDNSDSL